MTLQQLKYIVTVAETGNITEAANRLFISQPSLTNAIRELEKEMQITIFNRTNKGVTISNEGDLFLSYARQVLEQADLLEEKFLNKREGKPKFSKDNSDKLGEEHVKEIKSINIFIFYY